MRTIGFSPLLPLSARDRQVIDANDVDCKGFADRSESTNDEKRRGEDDRTSDERRPASLAGEACLGLSDHVPNDTESRSASQAGSG